MTRQDGEPVRGNALAGPAPPLPPLPDRRDLADACRAVAQREGVQAWAVEKDFYLTRLLWALAELRGDQLLLKGGTCLSKCDLGYRRLSEDVDMVVPLAPGEKPGRHKGMNAAAMNRVRDALRAVAPTVGVRLENATGEVSERGAHVIWDLPYESEFGPQGILFEAALRPVLLPPRRAPVRQLLDGPLTAGYEAAYCWALDFAEVRAEKVRAALTREVRAIRDFYDLRLLLDAGADMTSAAFVALVDRKLAEVNSPPLGVQPALFGLSEIQRLALADAARTDLARVVRSTEPSFELDAVLARYDGAWDKQGERT
jgi:hypothetical protein